MQCYVELHQVESVEMTADGVDNVQTQDVVMFEEGITDLPNDGINRWTTDATRFLICLRKEMNDIFHNPPCKLNKLWERVSSKMAEHNHMHNGEACRKKWGNLLRVYRKIRDDKPSERPRDTWEFYALMKEACGEKEIPTPSRSILCASGKVVSDSDDGLGRESTSEEPTNKLTRKRKSPPEWFTKYIAKRDKEREAEITERNNLEREKIETMKSVRDLLQALVNK